MRKTISEAAEVLRRLRAAGAWLATAESCTGGLIAHALTEVPGSSEAFWGSWITYHDEAKALLGVPSELISAHGAVSREVARAMAEAGLRSAAAARTGSRVLCVSTTGFAEPGKGTCWLGLADTQAPTLTRQEQAPPGLSREENKAFFAAKALGWVLETLQERT